MEFKERIVRLRKMRQLTQEELAKKIGVSTRTIQNYENGSNIPKKYTLKLMAEALEVEQSELASDEDLFVIDANESYGSRGRKSAQKLLDNAYALFAGGELSEKDKAAVLAALQDAYVEAKIINKKYTPKKYRKPIFEDENEKK